MEDIIETRHNTVVRCCHHADADASRFALKIFNTNERIWSEGPNMEVLALRLLAARDLPVPALEYLDTSQQ